MGKPTLTDEDRALIERVRAYIVEHKPRCYPDAGGLARRTAFQEIEDLLSAARQARTQGPGEGWVLVPRVPTVEMLVAATEEWLCVRSQEDRAEFIWDAMLAAAPPASQIKER